MMKKQSFTFEFDRPKTRAHKVLFENDSPFKPKCVKAKNQYKRREKFQKRSWDYDQA
jgi:hypothetical protein